MTLSCRMLFRGIDWVIFVSWHSHALTVKWRRWYNWHVMLSCWWGRKHWRQL